MVFKKRKTDGAQKTVAGSANASMSIILPSKTRKRKLFFGGLLVIFLIILFVVGYLYTINKDEGSKEFVASTVCTSDEKLISSFRTSLDKGDSEKMTGISDDISKRASYENDVNCLYMVTEAAIVRGDSSQARYHLGKLVGLLTTEKQEYSGVLKVTASSTDSLNKKVELLEQQKTIQQESINQFSPKVEN